MMDALLRLLLAPMLAIGASAAQLPDSDGDGIPDDQELVWGSDPRQPHSFSTIHEFPPATPGQRAMPDYQPALDIRAVRVAHIAEDRFLWQATFAGEVREDLVTLHLYLDSDGDRATGRRGQGAIQGTDYMISFSSGNARLQHFQADGARASSTTLLSSYVAGQHLYIMADTPIPSEAGRSATLHILCHASKAAGADGSRTTFSTPRRIELTDIPRSKLQKIVRFIDQHELIGFKRSYGFDMIREAAFGSPDNHFVPYDKLELNGCQIDLFTQAHLGQVISTSVVGRASAQAPPGRFHPGLIAFDRRDGSRFAMKVGDDFMGMAPLDIGNQRYWIYWLEQPLEFKGGERVEVMACGSGRQPLSGIIFLKTPPPLRELPYNIHHLTHHCPPGGNGSVVLSWITEMPSATRLEYGVSGRRQIFEESAPAIVHRATLSGLDPSQEYSAQAVGIRPDGTRYTSAPTRFKPQPPAPPPTIEKSATLPLSVRNPHGFTARRQTMTHGIPFPKATLANCDHLRLTLDGHEVPIQVRPTAWWPDYSIKWLLLSFITAEIAANGKADYRLEYGAKVKRLPAVPPLVELVDGAPRRSDGVPLDFSRAGELLAPDGRPCALRIAVKDKGMAVAGTQAIFQLEESGPLRAVVKVTRHFSVADGEPAFKVESRYRLCRDISAIGLQQTYTVLHQRPLLVSLPPEWNCSSGVFYPLAPRDTARFAIYEERIDKKIKGYAAARERKRDYGLMNFGDWHGERGSNWGNSEYDTQSAFLLELQDKIPIPLPQCQLQPGKPDYQLGGWSRMMVPGHCLCEPRHRGNAGFMVSVLLSGMLYYHDVTGDPAVKEAIIKGASCLVREGYSPEARKFRYTPCLKMRYTIEASPRDLEAVARAFLWTGDQLLRAPLAEALPGSGEPSGYGKGFSMYYRNAPRMLFDLLETGIKW